ncbi:helicase-exonuclease AddAB subunit AddA [Ligilactobacillus ceti]|uniref:ATP-dependent helicase/nuclease subunit A n=1 Tax=Ligilactobacillus ceti DSM 22408 TaxID=1122146 RepID=A0A0R2KJ51_9LACO|nr:helicase-exonuclease AddAB subunit AddA [Ligilactobacillus ceti]KRN89361.1 ATP-dependent deoxyribonuclease, subunit A [Ligilactobacillus ceti DSM 22408]
MAKITLTPAQEQAVYDSGKNILVAASAGSGKTRVLVQRVIEKIKSGISLNDLLVVTFTDAAAREMKERIQAELRQELKLTNDQNQKRYYQEQLLALNVANISTIDSFCSYLIKRYYYVIDLDPNFRMITDSMEQQLLREKVWEEVRESYYAQNDQEFEALTLNFASDRDDEALTEIVFKTFNYSRVQPDENAWLEQLSSVYAVSEESLTKTPLFTENILPILKNELLLAQENLQQAYQQAFSYGFDKVAAKIEKDLELITACRNQLGGSWDGIRQALQVKFVTLSGYPKKADLTPEDEIVKKQINGLVAGVKDQLKKLSESWFLLDEEQIKTTLQAAHPIVQKLSEVVQNFARAYANEKQQRHMLDFNDLERLSLEILTTNNDQAQQIQQVLQDNYQEIMIDEYQDTNALQEAILMALAKKNPGNVFMVGDVKQSIYGFRLADPTLFLGKYQKYAEPDQPDERIILAENFRSVQNVTEFTNLIFSQIMNSQVGEMVYDEVARLAFGAKYYPEETQQPTEVLIYLDNKAERTTDNTLPGDFKEPFNANFSVQSKIEGQVLTVAQRIKQMIANQEMIYDREQKIMRPIEYRDIVILVAAKKNNLLLTDKFQQFGIPLDVNDTDNYFQTTELQMMVSYLKIIDNPYQDIPLVAVLRSPIVGLKENELAYLRINDQMGDYYQALQAFVNEYQENKASVLAQKLYPKITNFLAELDRFRTIARQNKLATLIWEIYNQTGLLDYVGGMPGGKQRQANLHALYERATVYEKTSFKGLFQFVKFIANLEGKEDLSAAKINAQNNAVQVMTIHGSKGLEFPVVFLLDTTSGFNKQDLKGPLVLDNKYGVGINLLNLQQRIKRKTLLYDVILERTRQKNAAEEMRKLYVALTRAEQRLLIVGAYDSQEAMLAEWEKSANDQTLVYNASLRKNAKNLMSWIGMSLIRSSQFDQSGIQRTSDYYQPAYLKENQADFKVVLSTPDTLATLETKQPLDIQTWLKEQKEKIKNLVKSQSETTEKLSAEAKNYVDRMLHAQYPQAALTKTTAYQAVSEISQLMTDPDITQLPQIELQYQADQLQAVNRYVKEDLGLPKFMTTTTTVSAAQVGSAMHLLFQKVPLNQPITLDVVQDLLTSEVHKGFITSEVAQKVDCQAVVDFFASDFGREIQAHADHVYREVPFSLLYPAHKLFAGVSAQQTAPILVHGVIDGYLVLDDKVILFDYKTNYVRDDQFQTKEESIQQLKERYQGQLDLYAIALERILKREITHKYLYLVEVGALVELN